MMKSRRSLASRLHRLSSQLPPQPGPELTDVPPEWRSVVARHPEARERAMALVERRRILWPDREPTSEEFIDDDLCRGHYVYLECMRYGSLDKFLASVRDEDE